VRSATVVLGILGALVSLIGALWLLLGFSPGSERYTDDGMLYPGPQRSQVVPRLLRDQRRVSAVIVTGTALQLLAAVFGVLA